MPAPRPDQLLAAWQPTLGARFPLRREVAEQFLSVDVDGEASACAEGGLVVAKRRQGRAWIGALVVEPRMQGRGLGRRLLEHAAGRLRATGATEVTLGADYLHLLPGIPDPGPLGFFERMGAEVDRLPEFDLQVALTGWMPGRPPAAVAPAGSWDQVLDFLAIEFGGRWHWEAAEARRRGGSPACFLLLRVDGAVAGFARLHHQETGSPPPGLIAPSAYWWPGRAGYGGIGPIGVGRAFRGRGLGLALLEAAMAHLRRLGVRELAIDFTTLVDFYARAGLAPCRRYRRAHLRLG